MRDMQKIVSMGKRGEFYQGEKKIAHSAFLAKRDEVEKRKAED